MTLHFHPSGAFSRQHQQTTSDVQAVIVCIRFATYIGVTILVVALAYKVAKVNIVLGTLPSKSPAVLMSAVHGSVPADGSTLCMCCRQTFGSHQILLFR